MSMTGPLPAAGKVIRVQLLFEIGAGTFGTHHYFSYTGSTPSVSDLTTLGGDINTAVGAHLLALLNSTYTYLGCILTDLSVVGGVEAEVPTSAAGTRSPSPLSAAASATINWLIARRYRGGRPRSFFPFGGAADTSSPQAWSSAFQATVAAAWTAYTTAVVGTTVGATVIGPQVSVSYFQGFTPVLNPITGRYRNVANRRTTPVVDAVDGHVLAARIGSQRRRL